MAVQKVFSIRDTKSETFHSPFYAPTHGEAERTFRTAVNDEKTMLHKYPEDFDLYFVGEWDQNSGKMTTMDTPQHIVKAINVLQKEH